MSQMLDRIVSEPTYDDAFYWARVNRNLGWLGDTEKEARERQLMLRDCTVGIAGCGGIGGGVADRLARLGVLNLKIADMDTFEISNINRQLGADPSHVGRNKAEVVAEIIAKTCPDVRVTAYPNGITAQTAEDFVDGCDFLLDEVEPYAFRARYQLHRAFRASSSCKLAFTAQVYGDRTFLWKWTKDGEPLEELLGLAEDAAMSPENAETLLRGLIPEPPTYPAREMQDHWLVDHMTCPILPGVVPMSQGLLVERLTHAITGIEHHADSKPLPEAPGYGMVDARTWSAKFVTKDQRG